MFLAACFVSLLAVNVSRFEIPYQTVRRFESIPTGAGRPGTWVIDERGDRAIAYGQDLHLVDFGTGASRQVFLEVDYAKGGIPPLKVSGIRLNNEWTMSEVVPNRFPFYGLPQRLSENGGWIQIWNGSNGIFGKSGSGSSWGPVFARSDVRTRNGQTRVQTVAQAAVAADSYRMILYRHWPGAKSQDYQLGRSGVWGSRAHGIGGSLRFEKLTDYSARTGVLIGRLPTGKLAILRTMARHPKIEEVSLPRPSLAAHATFLADDRTLLIQLNSPAHDGIQPELWTYHADRNSWKRVRGGVLLGASGSGNYVLVGTGGLRPTGAQLLKAVK
jgi:hypothetical protein